MRAYQLKGPGLQNLVVVDLPTPRLGLNDVLVRIRAASLNHRDLSIALGEYGGGKLKSPVVPLSDGAGEVVAVGADVTHFKVGDRVMGNFFRTWIDGPPTPEKRAEALGGAIDGVLAEEAIFSEAATVSIPDALSFEEASTLPCAGVTAWVGLVATGKLVAGQTVLAMGTGGVSIFALQLGKALGARVILTSSQDDKLALGRKLGADETINYRTTPAWDEKARALTGGLGVDQILEVGGTKTLGHSVRALRDGGHLALVGLLGGERATPDIAEAEAAKAGRQLRIDPVYVGSAAHLDELAGVVARTGLKPVINRVFPFAEARAAYAHMQDSAHLGKIVIEV